MWSPSPLGVPIFVSPFLATPSNHWVRFHVARQRGATRFRVRASLPVAVAPGEPGQRRASPRLAPASYTARDTSRADHWPSSLYPSRLGAKISPVHFRLGRCPERPMVRYARSTQGQSTGRGRGERAGASGQFLPWRRCRWKGGFTARSPSRAVVRAGRSVISFF